MLVRINKAAKTLDVSASHIRKMIARGRYPSYRIGNRIIRVDPEEIRAISKVCHQGVGDSNRDDLHLGHTSKDPLRESGRRTEVSPISIRDVAAGAGTFAQTTRERG